MVLLIYFFNVYTRAADVLVTAGNNARSLLNLVVIPNRYSGKGDFKQIIFNRFLGLQSLVGSAALCEIEQRTQKRYTDLQHHVRWGRAVLTYGTELIANIAVLH